MTYLSYLIPFIAIAITYLLAWGDVWKYKRTRYQTIDGVKYKKGRPNYNRIAELEHELLDSQFPFDHRECFTCERAARQRHEERKVRRQRASYQKARSMFARPPEVPESATYETIESYGAGLVARVWRWTAGGQSHCRVQPMPIESPLTERIYI